MAPLPLAFINQEGKPGCNRFVMRFEADDSSITQVGCLILFKLLADGWPAIELGLSHTQHPD